MRATSMAWANRNKDVDEPQDKFPKELISRSGRIRKIKNVSRDYFVGRDRVTTATATKTILDDSESVRMEEEVEPIETVEDASKRETVKDNTSRVNVDLLQKVLTESVEEWFSFTEVVKNNKGKPYKKRKIVLPPLDESDFCFDLTATNDVSKNPKDGEDKRLDSTSDKEPETRHSEEKKKNVENAAKKKDFKSVDKSKRAIDEVGKKKQDKHAEKENTEKVKEVSRPEEESDLEKGKLRENGTNRSFRHFFALILYGDQINGETESGMTTADSRPAISSRQAKTVIKTLDLETADLKEFEVELGDFCKLSKDSPLFETVNGIERLLHTGGTLRKSLSAESLNVFPQSESDRPKRSEEMPATLPSRQKKINLKARECFFVLKKDIIEKYKRKADYGTKANAEKLREQRNKVVITEEEELITEDSNETMVNIAERKQKPHTNECDHTETETNGLIEEKVEVELEKPEMKVLTNTTFTKTTRLVMKKQLESAKDNKMSGLRFKRRKRCIRTKGQHNLFSYVNRVKRKSGYRSSSESAESHNVANEEPTAQETRVDEEKETQPKTKPEEVGGKITDTKERRKSQREIKLTPKLVHMIATSYKRARRSPSTREDSGYEYPNLIKKVVSGTATPEVVESPPSESAIENYLQSKIEANASSFECSWQPGDLVWARFAGSPFWPSLILRDPFSNDEYTKVKYFGRLLKTYVHLQFLADSGRRAWVPEVYIMSFNGLEEFEKMKSNLPEIDAFTKRNDLVYQKAFFPTKKIEKAWLDAVKEGDALHTKSNDERIAYMKSKFPLVKYAEPVTNGGLVCNGTTSAESKKLSELKSKKRKTRSSSLMESSDLPNSESVMTTEEALANTDETFECVKPTDAEDNRKGDESDAPKITLKFVRSLRKEENKRWTRSSGVINELLNKKPKRNVDDAGSGSSTTGEGRTEPEEVYQVCLKMVDNKEVVKCNGVCSGLFRKSCRKTAGAGLPGVKEGGGSAPASQKKRKRKRKFSSPHVNRWKEKLWAIFDFYNEFGGCKREGMDVRALVALYRSLCNSKTGNKRRSAKLRKNK